MTTTVNVLPKGKMELPEELRSLAAAAGSLSRRQSAKEVEMVDRVIAAYRKEKRRKRD